jgi:hypothetical protein
LHLCTAAACHTTGVGCAVLRRYTGRDVQARGGGGGAERLHASCRHLVAVAEVESGERGLNVRTPASVNSRQSRGRRQRRQAAHCSHALVRHQLAPGEVEPSQTGCASTVAAPEATPRWRAWRSPTSSRRALACTGASSSPRTAAIARCSLRPSRHADEGVNVKVHPIHLPLRALRKLFVVPVGALPVPVSNGACIGPLSPIFPG